MHEWVRQVVHVGRVARVSEPAEALAVQVDGQRLIAGDQNVDSKVELLAADEQRVHDVALHNVRLGLRALWLPSQFIFPLGNLLQFVEKENAAALRLADGFHDPYLLTLILLEFLDEQTVVTGQVVRRWEEIVRGSFRLLALSLELLFVPLEVFNHKIFARQFEMVAVMINFLVGLQMLMTHDVVDLISLDPQDIPVVAFHFLVALLPEGIEHAISERRLELNL